MKFGKYYEMLFASCDVANTYNVVKISVEARFDGWVYYDGTVGNLPYKIFKWLEIFDVVRIDYDADNDKYTVYIQ